MIEKREYIPEIWVYCENKEERLTTATKELLGKARELAQEAGCQVTAILFKKVGHGAEEAVAYGAEKVYRFSACRNEVQAQVIAAEMESGRPWAFLFPATSAGRMVAAMLSVQLKTGLTADCIQLSIEDGYLKQTRPAFGGSLMADIFCSHSYPQMATVQKGVFPLPQEDKKRKGEIISYDNNRTVSPLKLLAKTTGGKEEKNLNDARIVLAGGMGLGSKKNFILLKYTAERIGAVPAASRAAVNAGFAPYAWQVGQSGKTIRPAIYIACGISGAVQHLSGVQGAACIVAVNQDKKAPIFDYADVGIIADAEGFLQKLIEGAE